MKKENTYLLKIIRAIIIFLQIYITDSQIPYTSVAWYDLMIAMYIQIKHNLKNKALIFPISNNHKMSCHMV